ncbi:DUF6122 family protein [Flavobacteriaceae bacterium S0862]|nr:DUF6122 family protein [Flavobacteriaceae bacterium S0862]
MLQAFVHYGIHFLVPLFIALIFFKSDWQKAFLIMIATMLIDLDHLSASPIFDANRCSINFHPLHSNYAIGLYILLTLFRKTRLLGIGLCIHIFADWCDCLFM